MSPGQRVVHDQGDAVEGAPLGVGGVAVGRDVARIEVVVGIHRDRRPLRIGRQRHDAGGHAAVLVQALVVPADQRGGVLAQSHLPGGARGPHVLAAQILAGGTVLEPTVAVIEQRVETQGRVVAGREVPHRIGVLLAVVAQAQAQAGLGLVLRTTGHQRDRAGSRVSAEQRALRALQHLDALDVDERQQHAATAAAVDAIDEHAHRRIGADAEVAGLRAPQSERRLGRLRRIHDQAGHEGVDVTQVVRRHVIEQLLVHDLQRDRHVLQLLLAALRGDDDGVQVGGVLFALRRRLGPCRTARPQHHAAAEQRAPQPDHQIPLRHFHHSLPRSVGAEAGLNVPAACSRFPCSAPATPRLRVDPVADQLHTLAVHD